MPPAASDRVNNVSEYRTKCVKWVQWVKCRIIRSLFDTHNACRYFQGEWRSGCFAWPHQLVGFLFRFLATSFVCRMFYWKFRVNLWLLHSEWVSEWVSERLIVARVGCWTMQIDRRVKLVFRLSFFREISCRKIRSILNFYSILHTWRVRSRSPKHNHRSNSVIFTCKTDICLLLCFTMILKTL